MEKCDFQTKLLHQDNNRIIICFKTIENYTNENRDVDFNI